MRIDAESLESFVAGLPKAELHVHHVGSATPDTVAALAARHAGTTSVPDDPDRLSEFFSSPTSLTSSRCTWRWST